MLHRVLILKVYIGQMVDLSNSESKNTVVIHE